MFYPAPQGLLKKLPPLLPPPPAPHFSGPDSGPESGLHFLKWAKVAELATAMEASARNGKDLLLEISSTSHSEAV